MTRVASRPLLSAHPVDALREGLIAAGIQGPHAFIRGLDGEYDLAIRLDDCLRPLPDRDDFRFSVDLDGEEHWVLAERLPWDSAFFGRGFARLNAVVRPGYQPAPLEDMGTSAKALDVALEACARGGISYITCSVNPADLPAIRTLSACGFSLLETRCYYHRALGPGAQDRYPVRLARPEDVSSIAKAARATVNQFDRFHADPAIAPEEADRLMEEWVHASVLRGFADATIVPDVPAPEAFCTLKYHREHWEGWKLRLAQPVLSAVSPRHKGWYVRLISEAEEHFRNVGAEHALVVTQLTNNAVFRCWEKLGYQFGKGEHVFRKVLGGSKA